MDEVIEIGSYASMVVRTAMGRSGAVDFEELRKAVHRLRNTCRHCRLMRDTHEGVKCLFASSEFASLLDNY